jgi:PAS domain S-box-containing protein
VQPDLRHELIKTLVVGEFGPTEPLLRRFHSEVQGQQLQVDCVGSWAEALACLARSEHDVCVVTRHVDRSDSLRLVEVAQAQGGRVPVVFLPEAQGQLRVTRSVEGQTGVEARAASTGRQPLSAAIDQALQRYLASRQAALDPSKPRGLSAAVRQALGGESAARSLRGVAAAILDHLDAACVRLWRFEPDRNAWTPVATETAGGASQSSPPPEADVVLEPAALTAGDLLLIQPVLGDARVPCQTWVQHQGIVTCAVQPLLHEARPIGLLTVFARHALPEEAVRELRQAAPDLAAWLGRTSRQGSTEFRRRAVVESVRDVIFQLDTRGAFTFLNAAWQTLTGHPVAATLGTRLADYVHPQDRERHRATLHAVGEREKPFASEEIRYLRADGTIRWVEVFVQPTVECTACGLSGTLRDVTERKRTEAEIQKLAAFVRLNPEAVMELAGDGTLTYVNPAARELAHTLGLAGVEDILPRDAATLAQECLRLGRNRTSQDLVVNDRTLSWTFVPIVASQVVHCYGRDITSRVQLETRLRHVQKMESVGQLAAAVAHDFNNILTVIHGFAHRLLELEISQALLEPLRGIATATDRATRLTRHLLTFSRKQEMQLCVLDMNAVLDNLANMLPHWLGEGILLRTDYSQALPPVEADSGMIEQVVMNLAVNARDAMPHGGQLHLSTSAVELRPDDAHRHPEGRPGRFVCLRVSDTGSGISPDILPRIFEPFFTTKPEGRGTGLGLATVYGIVKQHQGWVEVDSQPGQGTTFRVYFPACDKPLPPPAQPAPAAPPARGGRETILLVEDEPVLRELAHTILSEYEYEVIEASSGPEALQVWEAQAGRIDLLLTDLALPGHMTGRDLAQQLRERKPDLRVIYTTGYSADALAEETTLDRVRFLPKPYPPPQLAQTVRECLDVREAA